MKKFATISLIMMFLVSVLCGCTGGNESGSEGTEKSTAAATQAAESSEAAGGVKQETPAASDTSKKVVAGVFIRSMSNPYEIQLTEGAQKFVDFYNAKGANIELQILPCEGSDEKQINDLKAFCVKKDENTDVIVFMITNTDPLMAEVAEICEEAEVYWASLWNIPDGMHPKDYKYWVAHTGLDDFVTGKTTATELFASFDTPNQGNVLALKGMLAVSSSIKRYEGFEEALSENPDVKLLDVQAADWLASKAMETTETWLAKYPEIDAIWCANDDMAIGVIQALKAKGLNGKIQVCGADGTPDAAAALQAGDMACTMNNNPYVQCGYMLTYCYKALTGELDVEAMTPEERYFNTPGSFWTQENIDAALSETPDLDFDDLAYCYESAK